MVSDEVSTLSMDKTMVSRVKKSLTDIVSNRKRTVRYGLFCLLIYYFLNTCYDRRKDKPVFFRVEEMSKVKSKWLPNKAGNNFDLSIRGTRPVRSLSFNGILHPLQVDR